jgi:hypothetical protein
MKLFETCAEATCPGGRDCAAARRARALGSSQHGLYHGWIVACGLPDRHPASAISRRDLSRPPGQRVEAMAPALHEPRSYNPSLISTWVMAGARAASVPMRGASHRSAICTAGVRFGYTTIMRAPRFLATFNASHSAGRQYSGCAPPRARSAYCRAYTAQPASPTGEPAGRIRRGPAAAVSQHAERHGWEVADSGRLHFGGH